MTPATRSPAPADRAVHGSRSAARLAAVQALYQVDLGGDAAETVVRQFVEHRFGADAPGRAAGADVALFTDLVRGVADRRKELDDMLSAALTTGRAVERLELVLRVILETGAYELIACGDVPAAVVINEYVDIAADFFSDREAAVANGVLDRLARLTRPDESGGSAGAGETEAG